MNASTQPALHRKTQMTESNTMTPTDEAIIAWAMSHQTDAIKVLRGTGFVRVARAVLAKWGAPALASSEPDPMLPETKYNLGWASGWDAHARAHLPEKPAAVPASGQVGFDHKTAANFLNGKTVTDEEVRRFVACSRWAHDDRDGLRNTIADLRREIAQRDAEIALLKTSLLDVESPTQAAQAAKGLARVPLTDEQVQDLLQIGNPTEEETRLIQLGWNAAHGITAAQPDPTKARTRLENKPCD